MNQNPKKNMHMWPEGELPCIWMEAGVIDFKLCDKNQECETCSFDAIMRNQAELGIKKTKNKEQSVDNTEDIITSLIPDIKYDPNVYYGNRYWYIEPISKNKAFLGLNELAVAILPSVCDIILTEEEYQSKNQNFAWLVTDYGTLCLKSPCSGHMLKTNKALLSDIKTKNNKVWFSLVESNELGHEIATLRKGQDAMNSLKLRQERIFKIFQDEINNIGFDIGMTMQDGGQKLRSMEEILGSEKYFNIISKFFDNRQVSLPKNSA